MKPIRFITIALFSLSIISGRADVYSEAITSIEVNCLDLKQLSSEKEIEILTYKVENGLADTQVEFTRLWSPVERKWDLSITQEFDFPGAYAARRKELSAKMQALDYKYKATLTDKVLQAYELLIQIAYYNKALDLENSIVGNLTDITNMLQTAFNNGQVSILELNRAKIELANNIVKKRSLLSQKAECESRLAILGVDRTTLQHVPYPILQLMPRENYINHVNDDPTVIYYQELKKANLMGLKARKMENMPGFSLGYLHEREGDISYNGITVGLTLPFFNAKNRSELASAQITATAWNEAAARIEREAVVNTDYSAAISNKEVVDMLAPVFYNSNHAVLLDKAYKGGQLSVVEYLNEIVYFKDAEFNFLEVEMNYHLSLARLNKYQLLLK